MARAIKAVLANRKMFRGGGLTDTAPAASGILSSSSPLIDAVTADAVNPQGGGTLSMNQGGVARFHMGGTAHAHPHGSSQSYRPGIGIGRRVETGSYPQGYPDVTPEEWRRMVKADPSLRDTPKASSYEYVDSATPDESYAMAFPPTTTRGPGTETIDIGPFRNMQWSPTGTSTTSPAEVRYNMMFPYSAEVDAGLHSMNPPLEENLVSQESWFGEGAPSYAEMGASLPAHVALFLGQLGTRLTYHGGKTLRNSIGFLFEKQDDKALGWGKTRAFTNMIAAQPDYAVELGQISDALMATEEGQNMSPDEYRLAISETFYNQKTQEATSMQGISQEGRVTDLPDITRAEEIIADTSPLTQQEARVTILGEKGLADDLRTYQGMMDSPDQQLAFIQELTASKGSGYVQNLLARVDEVGDQEIAIAEAPVVAGSTEDTAHRVPDIVAMRKAPDQLWPGAEVTDRDLPPPPPEKPDAPIRPLETVPPPTVGEEPPDVREGLPYDRTAANAVVAAFGESEEAGVTSVEDYIKRFTDAMPDYEGKSEWEKGMDIVKMGMAIAAGQSSDAITNVANGVYATIDNFTDDEKERRAYKQQVEISAAKYALEAVDRDVAHQRAMDKEGREVREIVATEDVFWPNGDIRAKKGTSFFLSNADIHSGDYDGQVEGIALAAARLEADAEYAADQAVKSMRVMIGATKQGGPSDTYIKAQKETYLDAATRTADYATQLALTDASLALTESGQTTGLGTYLKVGVNKFYNAFNIGRGDGKQIENMSEVTDADIEAARDENGKALSEDRKARLKNIRRQYSLFDKYAAEGRETQQFIAQQNELANLLIREILGEGSKNISNIDRELAREIIGLYSGRAMITADPQIVADKLGRIRDRILKNYNNSIITMDTIETEFGIYIDRAERSASSVSYTHLTLPTNREV